jgi:hypothetical protein
VRLVVLSLALIAIAAGTARADDPHDDRAQEADADAAIQQIVEAPDADEVVEIHGTAPEQAQPIAYEVTADEVRAIPGAANDTLRALQGLPGVSRIPFSFGGLVLRGTAPRDSHVYLDGVEVPIAFHFGGITSFYPSAMLDRVELVNGGVGAEYGRGTGGVVALTTRAARTDRWRVGSEVSLIDSSVRADGPALGGGLTIGVRRSYIDAILAAVLPDDDRVLPRYYDAQLRWSAGDPRGRAGALTAMIFYSNDQVSTPDSTLSSWFVRGALSWSRQVGQTHLTIAPWIGSDVLSFHGPVDTPAGDQATDATQERSISPLGLRAQIVRDAGWGHLAAGLDARGARYGQLSVDVNDHNMIIDGDTTDYGLDAAVWTEALWRAGRLDLRPGVRVEHYGDTAAWVVDPRLNTSVALGDGVIMRQALGLYHQPPNHVDLSGTRGNPMLRASWAVQAAVGLDVTTDSLELSVTGYAVDQHDLPVEVQAPDQYDPPRRSEGGLGPIFEQLLEAQLGSFQYRESVGRGRSLGVELSIKRHVGAWLTWLSYTYGRAYRTDDPTRFHDWRPYELDQPHNLSAIVATHVGAWQLGARVRVTSGDPYTPIDVVRDGDTYTSTIGPPLSARLPIFAALDLRVDRVWTRSWGTIDAYLDVQNATNRTNIEGRSQDDLGEVRTTKGLPILPVLGVSYTPR